MQFLDSEVSADYYTHPLGSVTLLRLTVTYIWTIALLIHTQGRFNNHTVCKLVQDHGRSSSVMGVMKMGNTAPKAGLKSTSPAFRARALTITPHRLP